MKLALILAVVHGTAFANVNPSSNVTAKIKKPGHNLEATSAVVEKNDGSLCYLEVAARPDLVPASVPTAAPTASIETNLEACGPDVVADVSQNIGLATTDARVAALPGAAMIPAICVVGVGIGAFSGTSALSYPKGPSEPYASIERGYFAGFGAGGTLLFKGPPASIAMAVLGVVGMSCALAGEFATYQIYYLFKPRPKTT